MKKNYVYVAASLGLAQLALFNVTAQAQSVKLGDTVTNLNPVVVTATRSPEKLSDIGRSVTVITAQQISQSQGYTLPELLNNVAGITFSGVNNARGISSDVYVRGATAGRTLILIDGFPVNDASGITGNFDLNFIPVDQVERIEILKGSNSTLYGSDAVAGVINIITKKGNQHNDLQSSVQAGAGSYKTFTEAFGLNGLLAKNTNIALNLSNTDSGGFPAATDVTGNAGFKNDAFHQRSASLVVNYSASQKLTLNGNLQTSYDTGDLPYGAFTDDINYTYKKTYLFGGAGAKLQLPYGALTFNASQNNVWNNFINLPFDNGGTNSVTRNLGRISNIEAILNQGLGKYFDLTSGLDYKYSNTIQFSSYSSGSYTAPTTTISPNATIGSAYSSLLFKSDVFDMELGGRYNHHSKYGNNFNYTINPSVLLAQRVKIYGSIASAYVTPSLYQLFSQYGNVALKPETTTSYEAGFDVQVVKDVLSLTTDFFRRRTGSVIYFYTDPATYNSIYKNGSLQDDKGFESTLKLNYKQMILTAYTAYAVGKQTDANGVETGNLLRRPKNTYGATVAYQFNKMFSATVNYKYTGGRFDTEYLSIAPYSRIDALSAYNLFDLHLQAEPTKRLSVYLDLKNIFNAKYVDWVGYRTRGFNVFGGIKYWFIMRKS